MNLVIAAITLRQLLSRRRTLLLLLLGAVVVLVAFAVRIGGQPREVVGVTATLTESSSAFVT